jgi:uncharacterized OB-fold protein
MNFEEQLRNGNFQIAECINCKKIVWPPSDFCNQCLNEVCWRKCSNEGKIIEFSKQNNFYFCLAEFENNIKIIGKISSGIPEKDKQVRLERCGIKDGKYFFEFSTF